MATKKTAKKTGAKGSAKAARGRGRPFEKGNPHAWRQGQSGNPSGGSKAQTLSSAYRHKLKEPWPDDPSMTYADAVADTLAKAAAWGDVGAAKEMADRTEGRAPQSLNITTEKQLREIFNSSVAMVAAAQGLSRDEAAKLVAAGVADVCPEANDWIN